MTVLICTAHPDDEVIGAGGTIAKISENEEVINVLFSYGDKYPFWKENEQLRTERLSEYKKCARILGITKTYHLGYHDLELKKNINDAVSKLKKIITKHKPSRVFTHTITDGHPDHRAVHEATIKAVKESFIKTQVLTFDINFFNFQKGIKVIYDISNTFNKKMQALSEIKSQHGIIILLKPLILLKALMYGLQSKYKYAEAFTTL